MKTIYDQSVWEYFLLKNRRIKLVREKMNIEEKTFEIHYYLKRIGPFSIIGAPLFATTTGPMCLVLHPTSLVLQDYVRVMKELGSRSWVISVEMLKSDLEFSSERIYGNENLQISKYTHYEIDLTASIDAIYANFNTNVKRKLKKSEKNNLTVKIEEPNIEFADKYYLMLIDVFKRQGKKPTYPVKRVRDLLSTVELSDNLLCLGVFTEDNVKIASGIYVYNEFKSFFWGGASYEDYMYLCPNEKMHFEAMKILKSQGVCAYEFGGGGSYKERYGPVKKEGMLIIYSKYYWILNLRGLLFRVYKRYFQKVSR